jgi:hypothetical protein
MTEAEFAALMEKIADKLKADAAAARKELMKKFGVKGAYSGAGAIIGAAAASAFHLFF